MRKITLLMHVSLDGYTAGPAGEMDWIEVGDEEIWRSVEELTADADAALFGRVTYEMMAGYWPTAAAEPGATAHDIAHARWVNAATKLVVSRNLDGVSWAGSRLLRDAGELARVKQEAGGNILLIGSVSLAQTLMALGLVDELRLNLNPVVLGAGRPLFAKDAPFKLRLMQARPFPSGVVGLHYASA